MLKRTLYSFFALFFVANSVFAYENDWIDYSKTYHKIVIDQDGLYRIPYSTLTNTGLPLIGNGFKIYYQGQEIPIFVSANGSFGSSDFIEFVGEENKGNFDTQLFQDPSWQISTDRSLFTDEATYFLTWDDNTTNLRYQNQTNNLSNVPTPETHFQHTEKKILNTVHFAGEPFSTLSGVNSNYADFGKGEGWVGAPSNIGTDQTYSIDAPALYNNGSEANIQMRTVGRNNIISPNDHHLQVFFNNVSLLDTFVYDGYALKTHNVGISLNEIEDNNTLIIRSLGGLDFNGNPIENDRTSLCYAYLSYPRSFSFGDKKSFWFEVFNTEDRYLEITDFDGGAQPVLYDLTNNIRIFPTKDGDIYKVFLPKVTGPVIRKLFLSTTTSAGSGGVQSISSTSPRQFTDFSDPSLSANYVIITHPSLRTGAVDEVQRYSDYRASVEGGNYNVLTVDITELYDQFAWGIQQHPISIRDFVNFIQENHQNGTWSDKPDYLLLLGRSIRYTKTNFGPDFIRNLIPTYGESGSDMMLTSPEITAYNSQMAVGRVSAENPTQIKGYLDKVIEHEALINSSVPCTEADRLWMKNVVHSAGGKNVIEATRFTDFLNDYKSTVENRLWGAKVLATFSKAQGGIVGAPELFEELFNNGLSLLTYIGHSNGELWEFNIEDPEDYDNKGKYPFIYSNSCFVGDVHSTDDNIMATRYSLAEERGAIAFLATVGFGFPTYLDYYAETLYQNFTEDYYGEPIGFCMQKTIEELYIGDPNEINYDGVKLTCQEFTLAGDPAVKLLQWKNPEYAVKNSDIFFEPQIPTTAIDSFEVGIVVTNLGKAVSDSFNIDIIRDFPDGTIETTTTRFPGVIYKDTLMVKLPMNEELALGNNNFVVKIDGANELTEDCEDNNEAGKALFILPSSALPIYPCPYSIIGKTDDIILQASTSVPILDEISDYIFQIDTLPEFTSPLKQETTINSSGGVLEWRPQITWESNQEYYWRISTTPELGEDFNWQTTSFTYLEDSPEGWSQSDYGQYNTNFLEDLFINNDKKFEFASSLNNISGKTHSTSFLEIENYLNSNLIAAGSCMTLNCAGRGGIAFMILKPSTLLQVVTSPIDSTTLALPDCEELGIYGNNQCGADRIFEFHTGDPSSYSTILNFMQNGIQDGYYVLAYSVNNHRMENTAATITELQPLYNEFAALGFPEIANIDPSVQFAFIGRKGVSDFTPQHIIADEVGLLEFDFDVFSNVNSGKLNTNLIGPASEWRSLQWKNTTLDNINEDEMDIDVYGVTKGGDETFLFNTNNIFNWDISFIDAGQYPFLRLKSQFIDELNLTAPQLNYWRVLHKKVPEIAINKNIKYVFTDTLLQGQNGQLQLGFSNTSNNVSDSLTAQVSIVNNNIVGNTTTFIIPPIQAHQNYTHTFNFGTGNFFGDSYIYFELNPNQQKPEKYEFNNQVTLPFYVKKDVINPIIDVTFDGQHILDGDIVSPLSEIDILLKDDNPFLALNDTSLAQISMIYPDGNEYPIVMNAPNVSFTPANTQNGKNEARIVIQNDLEQDGTYQLKVSGQDKTGNDAADLDYVVSFEVINTPMISHVLNYPNPFTTSTQFVFTLTGREVPQNLKIQVMNISGRVVREITQAELGEIRIGRNITEYAWDGKDEFGNELANGVYFYRVVAKLNSENLDLFTKESNPLHPNEFNMTSTQNMDDLFNKFGIGKMYKMR